MFKKVRTKKVYMYILEQIQDLIKEGKLKVGDKLPSEHTLGKEFGASRPSVREALTALEILGMTESRGGKGNFIRDDFSSSLYEQRLERLREEESPFELLETRRAVESEIAVLAAEKATPEDIREIEEALNKMKNALNDIPRAMEFDGEFHIALAKAAHNSILLRMMNRLADGLNRSLWVNIKEKSWAIPAHRQKYLEDHAKLLEAVKKRDKKVAGRAMRDHLGEVQMDLLKE